MCFGHTDEPVWVQKPLGRGLSLPAIVNCMASEGLKMSTWQTKKVFVDIRIRPPACSKYWPVRCLAQSSRPLCMETIQKTATLQARPCCRQGYVHDDGDDESSSVN